MNNKQLKLSEDEMRKLGYKVIDTLVAHFQNLSSKPVSNSLCRKEAEELLNEPLPHSGSDPVKIVDQLKDDVFTNIMHLDHPRFFGWVSSPGNYVSVMADLMASGFNTFSGLWMLSSGPAQIELTTLDWLKQIVGFPQQAGGLFVSGGSVANLTALAVARNIRLNNEIDNAVIYCSDQTHSSNERALKILGFKTDQIKKIPSDERFRINLKLLEREISEDKKNGKIPFCIIANAGTTNTGAVDPLKKIRSLCDSENIWMHIDGAFGAAAVLDKRGKALLSGMEEGDSLTVDPHKWLFQPYEIGCVLIKNETFLKDTFYILPEYLKDTERGTEEVNFSNRGIQLTRGFRALKLWMSIKTFGIDSFSHAVSHGIRMSKLAEREIKKLSNWELVTKAQLGILTFRYIPQNLYKGEADRVNKEIIEELIRDKFALLSSSCIKGKVVLRMCIINPRTTKKDITDTVFKLNEISNRLDNAEVVLNDEKNDFLIRKAKEELLKIEQYRKIMYQKAAGIPDNNDPQEIVKEKSRVEGDISGETVMTKK